MSGITSPQSPCFTPGALIETETGRCPVEDLTPGRRVLTRDNGFAEVLWIGGRTVSFAEMSACRDLRPVLIRAGALGPGRPATDMRVSPQHRVLIEGAKFGASFLESEVLIAARHLIDGDRVLWDDAFETRYIHVMCEAHQVIRAENTWVESFHAAPDTLKSVPRGLQDEITLLLPDAMAGGQKAARRIVGAA